MSYAKAIIEGQLRDGQLCANCAPPRAVRLPLDSHDHLMLSLAPDEFRDEDGKPVMLVDGKSGATYPISDVMFRLMNRTNVVGAQPYKDRSTDQHGHRYSSAEDVDAPKLPL